MFALDEDKAPSQTYGMGQLGEDEKSCVDTCLVVMIPHGSDQGALKERRRRMAAANDVLKSLKASGRKQSLPPAVWASTSQLHVFAALKQCGGGADVSMAVWKLKRNRAAVLTQPLTVASGSQFLAEVLAGNGNFCALAISADVMLGNVMLGKRPGEHEEAAEARKGVVPAAYLDWSHPSNVLQEMENVPTPVIPLAAAADPLDSVTPPSDDALLL
jgi:hypothetical protein